MIDFEWLNNKMLRFLFKSVATNLKIRFYASNYIPAVPCNHGADLIKAMITNFETLLLNRLKVIAKYAACYKCYCYMPMLLGSR